MSKKCYLAGPMSNIPQFNFPAFFSAEKELEARGYEVFNPARKDVENHGDAFYSCIGGSHEELAAILGYKADYKHFLKIDLNWILDNADAIAFLPGWENSKGVKAEKALAECLNLEQIYL